jgi:hypothetical protein
VKIRFNCVGYIDRRSLSLTQHHDELMEQEWRRRVALNPKERARLARERPTGKVYLIKQAG